MATKKPLKHIAVIMDGNGRYAKKKGLPRLFGHREGVKNFENLLRLCIKHNVPYLTVYAFSTENWRRPEGEVSGLFDLMVEFFKKKIQDIVDSGTKIVFIGDLEALPLRVQEVAKSCEDQTAKGDQLTVQVALNHGARNEIQRAVQAIVSQGISPGDITEEVIEAHLDTKGIPDPDLLIRTGGEQRLSNFLLWQLAYTEFYFTKAYWPDFDEEELLKAMDFYHNKDRRFGGLNES